MEQFSLEKYLANPSRKVVTRYGINARIVCTDRRDDLNNHSIVALLKAKFKEEEIAFYYTIDGTCSYRESAYDLFFAPQKHEGWINIYRDSDNGRVYTGRPYDSKEDAEKRKAFDENYVTTIKIEWDE